MRFERRSRQSYIALHEHIAWLLQKFNTAQVALVGHSGGATAVAGALTLGLEAPPCIALSAGAYSLAALWEHQTRSGLHHAPFSQRFIEANHDILPNIAGIREDQSRHILLLQDPSDMRTPWSSQEDMLQALKAAGHRASLLAVEAPESDPERHRTEDIALKHAVACLRGGDL